MKEEKILIIVESPSKTKTIQKKLNFMYPNNKFICICTRGHMFDLSYKNMGIVKQNNKIVIDYIELKNKRSTIEKIKKQITKFDTIYLSTDPDREGELISFLIKEKIINKIKNNKKIKVKRLLLHEITDQGIERGMNNLIDINLDIVFSQQVRRIYDRLYGFILSYPVSTLFKPLGVGRIQTPVLKAIVNRDNEVENFVPEKYYDIFCFNNIDFKLKFKNKIIKNHRNKQKLEPHVNFINNNILHFKFKNLKTKFSNIKRLNFLHTADILQLSHGLSNQAAMFALQKLYEEGWITYPRTDSRLLSFYGKQNIIKHIKKYYGEKYLNPKLLLNQSNIENKVKKSKQNKEDKFAQQAHECIRISNFKDSLSSQLLKINDEKQKKMFSLIYLHSLAPLMSDVKIENNIFLFTNLDYSLEIISKHLIFDGWWKLKSKKIQEINNADKNWEKIFFHTKINFGIKELYTKPLRGRYNYSSIVKFMFNNGLARPSTYSYIVKILMKHKLIYKKQNTLISTNLGRLLIKFVNLFLKQWFTIEDTYNLELLIENVALKKQKRDDVIIEVWDKLKKLKIKILSFKETLQKAKIKTDIALCKFCKSKKLELKFGAYGQYIKCIDCNKNISILAENLFDISVFLNKLEQKS